MTRGKLRMLKIDRLDAILIYYDDSRQYERIDKPIWLDDECSIVFRNRNQEHFKLDLNKWHLKDGHQEIWFKDCVCGEVKLKSDKHWEYVDYPEKNEARYECGKSDEKKTKQIFNDLDLRPKAEKPMAKQPLTALREAIDQLRMNESIQLEILGKLEKVSDELNDKLIRQDNG